MNITFQTWLKQLNAIFTSRLLFITYYDAEDYNWHSDWTSEITPDESFQGWYDSNWGNYL